MKIADGGICLDYQLVMWAVWITDLIINSAKGNPNKKNKRCPLVRDNKKDKKKNSNRENEDLNISMFWMSATSNIRLGDTDTQS